MTTFGKSERTARTGQGGGKVNQMVKRYLTIGILGMALVLAFVAAMAVKQGSRPTTSVADAPAVAVPANVTTGGQYRLSAPNELDPDGSGAIAVGNGPAVYRVSAPNEADPDGTLSGGAAPATYPPYRVSPPNEQHPSGD